MWEQLASYDSKGKKQQQKYQSPGLMRVAAQGTRPGRNRALLAGASPTVAGLCEGQAKSQADPTFLLL